MSRVRRIGPITALFSALLLAVTGCTSSSGDDEGKLPTGAEDTYWTNGVRPAPSESGRFNGGQGLCDDPEAGGGSKRDAFCNNLKNDTPWYDPSGENKMTYKAGRAPHSTLYSGHVNVEAFLLEAMRSQRTTWREYFRGSDITAPNFAATIVTGSEKFRSSCPVGLAGDNAYESITATSRRVLYCPSADQSTPDQIAFPASTIAMLWRKHDRKTGDMAAAIVASRAGGLMLNRKLALHQQGSVLDPYLGSSCLAGVWARGVYPKSSESDLDRALNYARRVMVEIGNGTEPNAETLDLAWFQGYQSADTSTCTDTAKWLKDSHYQDLLQDEAGS